MYNLIMKSLILVLSISILYLNLFDFYVLASEQVNEEDGFEVSDEILAIVGDIDYGEYVSSECTT